MDTDQPCGPEQRCWMGWCHSPESIGSGSQAGGDATVDGGVTDGGGHDAGGGRRDGDPANVTQNDATRRDGEADTVAPRDSGRDAPDGDAGEPTVIPGWVLIDVSTAFMMGSPETEFGRSNDEQQHEVTLTRDFWLMTTEVTQAAFEDLMGHNRSYSEHVETSSCEPTYPVEMVTWHELVAYGNALSATQGWPQCYECTGDTWNLRCVLRPDYLTPYDCPGYRLPTEAEWEYAARAGTTTATYNGDLDVDRNISNVLKPIAWYDQNSGFEPHPVAKKGPNSWGLYDMLGNVWEWCLDSYAGYLDGPLGTEARRAVVRGGSFNDRAGLVRRRTGMTPSGHNRTSTEAADWPERTLSTAPRKSLFREPFNIVALGNIAVAVLVVAVSPPLLGDKIPMNDWYGVRIAKSFVSKNNWYRINRYGGPRLIVYGMCLALFGVVALLLPPPKKVNLWFWTVSLGPAIGVRKPSSSPPPGGERGGLNTVSGTLGDFQEAHWPAR